MRNSGTRKLAHPQTGIAQPHVPKPVSRCEWANSWRKGSSCAEQTRATRNMMERKRKQIWDRLPSSNLPACSCGVRAVPACNISGTSAASEVSDAGPRGKLLRAGTARAPSVPTGDWLAVAWRCVCLPARSQSIPAKTARNSQVRKIVSGPPASICIIPANTAQNNFLPPCLQASWTSHRTHGAQLNVAS